MDRHRTRTFQIGDVVEIPSSAQRDGFVGTINNTLTAVGYRHTDGNRVPPKIYYNVTIMVDPIYMKLLRRPVKKSKIKIIKTQIKTRYSRNKN